MADEIKEIKEMAEAEIERFKLEAENKILTMEGCVREAVQCTKNNELMFNGIKEQVEKMSDKFKAIKIWLLGTNGNTVSEEDIQESFIVQFTDVKKDLVDIKKFMERFVPWHIRAWNLIKKYPKTAGTVALLILNALGFSTAGILNFFHKINMLAVEVDKVIPK